MYHASKAASIKTFILILEIWEDFFVFRRREFFQHTIYYYYYFIYLFYLSIWQLY